MATETDIGGIRQIIKPLEDNGTLVRRTDEEVYYYLFSPNVKFSNFYQF